MDITATQVQAPQKNTDSEPFKIIKGATYGVLTTGSVAADLVACTFIAAVVAGVAATILSNSKVGSDVCVALTNNQTDTFNKIIAKIVKDFVGFDLVRDHCNKSLPNLGSFALNSMKFTIPGMLVSRSIAEIGSRLARKVYN